jgi:hypothetical protein
MRDDRVAAPYNVDELRTEEGEGTRMLFLISAWGYSESLRFLHGSKLMTDSPLGFHRFRTCRHCLHIADEGDDAIPNEAMQARFHLQKDYCKCLVGIKVS